MDINALLKGLECECGRKHTCDIDAVYIARGAVEHLEEVCRDAKKVLVVCDENTIAAQGGRVEKALSKKVCDFVIFSGSKILVPDEKAVGAVEEALSGVDMLVGVGSGVIQDLCKYVSFKNGIPYAVVATAPSMDGYASNGAAMIMGGMKVTYSAGLPRAILADPEVLKSAPLEMIRAGFGDIVGKYSALNDWKLSALVTGEYFCKYIYDLTFLQIERVLNLSSGLVQRDEKSVSALMEALVAVGILMSFAGSSRPASGSEHHLSHFFEIVGIVEGTKYLPHGTDVAFSTVVTSEVREKILKNKFPEKLWRESEEERLAALEKVYRRVGAGCAELQKKLGTYERNLLCVYLEKEEEIKEILAEVPPSSEIRRILASVGLDMEEFYSLYGEEKIKNAVLWAKDLKDRYTVLWLNYDLFGGE